LTEETPLIVLPAVADTGCRKCEIFDRIRFGNGECKEEFMRLDMDRLIY